MTDPLYGPDKPCRRTACIAADPVTGAGAGVIANHLGGAHLDPHDRERFDGVHISHITYKIRSDLYALLAVKKDHPELAETIDTAVVKATDEIDFLGQQIAHVRVDADHKVRDAMRRAADCTEHGKMITDLEAQVTHFDRSRERTEKARLALLGEHQAIRDFLDKYDTGQTREGLDVAALVEALRKMNRRASAAHQRAWNS